VIVLEARNRVGGRVLNHDVGGGAVAELGAMCTGPTQDRILELAKSLDVKTFPTYNTGNNVFLAPGRRQTFPAEGPTGTAPLDPVVTGDIAAVVTALDGMAAEVSVDAPWQHPRAAEWDGQTLYSWLKANSSGTDEFMAVVSAATEAIFGCEARDISLLYTLFYIAASGNEKNVGTFERNFNTKDGAQERRFVGGAQLIALRLAKSLGRPRGGQGQARGGGDSTHADLADPLPAAVAGRARPADPATAAGHAAEGRRRVRQAVLARQGADGAGRERARTGDDLRQAALRNFADMFGDEALSPREVVIFSWSDEEWNRGCPVALLPPRRAGGLRTRAAPAVRPRPLGRHRDVDLLERLHGRGSALR
jgi:monoamine oxidase